MQRYLAIDIGASGGRHILGHLADGQIVLEEIYRFENTPVQRNGQLCWNLPELLRHVIAGLKRCAELEEIPATLGIDTWGVDFVLLDANGDILGDSVAYRDSRTAGMEDVVHSIIPEEALYARTGIQKQPFNTIYQLAAVKRDTPEYLEQAERLLMIPEYLHYCLTGNMVSEYTNATTTGLVDARGKTWDTDLLESLGYPSRLFGPLCKPGTVIGPLSEDVRRQAGFACTVVLPPTHDTASAFLSVPASGGCPVFISSGTWSLLGVELPEPVTTEPCRQANFTNEGGYGGRFRFLRNIMGLWMLQSVRRESGHPSYPELAAMARASSYAGVVDVNNTCFLAPRSMTEAVKQECVRNGYPEPDSTGDVLQCIYISLARSYAQSVRELDVLTGRRHTCIHIIGGGSQDVYLNKLTAKATGLPVYAGPTEGTALGNIVSQMIAAGELFGAEDARKHIRRSFEILEIQP